VLVGMAPAQSTRPPTRVNLNLRYGTHGASNMLDLYLPAKSDAPVPVVIWIHGG
jgi:acetyl esterase/lipase